MSTIEQLRRFKFIDQSTLKLPDVIQLLIKTTESPDNLKNKMKSMRK